MCELFILKIKIYNLLVITIIYKNVYYFSCIGT